MYKTRNSLVPEPSVRNLHSPWHTTRNDTINTNFTSSWLHGVYICYTQLLHVSATYPGHLKGVTILAYVDSAYDKLLQINGTLHIYIYI